MSTAVAWGVMLAGSVAAGAAACSSLVLTRRSAVPAVASAVILTAAAATALAWIGRATARGDVTIAGGFLAVGAALGGFALAAALVPAWTRMPPPPQPPSVLPPANGGPRLVLVADAEPERYTPRHLTAELEDLAASDVPLPPHATRVFAYLAERTRYRSLGISPSRPTVESIAEAAGALLEGSALTGSVLTAYCSYPQRVVDVVAAEIDSGAREFAIAYLGAAEDRAFHRAMDLVHEMRLDSLGISVTGATPLWADPGIAQLVASRTLGALESGPGQHTGALLVVSGRPWQWDRSHPLSVEHETFFSQRVRALLVEAGLAEDRVRTAYLDWQEPDVDGGIRHLAALGCTNIAVCPATAAVESLETLVDLRVGVEQSATATGVTAVVAPAWGNDPAVARSVARALSGAAEDLPDRGLPSTSVSD